MSKHWWCPTCKIEVAPYNVTNDERHEQCGCPVEWVEEGAAPRDDLQVRIRELEEQMSPLIDERDEAREECERLRTAVTLADLERSLRSHGQHVPDGATLFECWLLDGEFMVLGDPLDDEHDCDQLGCSSVSHVAARWSPKWLGKIRELEEQVARMREVVEAAKAFDLFLEAPNSAGGIWADYVPEAVLFAWDGCEAALAALDAAEKGNTNAI